MYILHNLYIYIHTYMKIKVKIIPLFEDSLGVTPKQFGNRLKQIGITVGTAQVQKTVLLGTARILRKFLEI